uniref:Uncharacterized protein n=1 Tax=Parascaris equorum TaxID=6256 RepID=A0A914RI19_PAREQ
MYDENLGHERDVAKKMVSDLFRRDMRNSRVILTEQSSVMAFKVLTLSYLRDMECLAEEGRSKELNQRCNDFEHLETIFAKICSE